MKTPEPEPAETEEEDGSENEASEDEESGDLFELAIPFLDVANEPVNAVETHANYKVPELYGKKDINAFAKVCGREWTYYVCDTRIVFGREPEDSRQSFGPGQQPDEKAEVHVDMGPSKTVSRNHAQLYFNSNDDRWHFTILGRNGAKINDVMMRKGEDRAIQSGDVISVAGTQMLFQSATGKAVLPPMLLDRIYGRSHDEKRSAERSGLALSSNAVKGGSQSPGAEHFQPQMTNYAPPYVNGQTPIAPAPPGHLARPVTPEPSSSKAAPSSGKKKSPKNQRGMVMESTEQIDYSLDSSKDLKPGCSYAAMITWAIMSTPEEALSLNGIYDWIKKNYAYYRLVPSGWQVGRTPCFAVGTFEI